MNTPWLFAMILAREFSVHVKRISRWTIGAGEPQRPTESARTGVGARVLDPAANDLVRLIRIDEYVPVAIVRTSLNGDHLLVPAMSTAEWIWLRWKNQILMHPGIPPTKCARSLDPCWRRDVPREPAASSTYPAQSA